MQTAPRTPLPRTSSSRVRTWQLLAALPFGIIVGLLLRHLGAHGVSTAHIFGQLGQLWLNALRMTLIPLVFFLMTAGVAGIARTASGGRVARIAVTVFLGLLCVGSILGAVVALCLMVLWPVAPLHAAVPPASSASPSLLAEFVS